MVAPATARPGLAEVAALAPPAALEELGGAPTGLTAAEAARRLSTFGPNQVRGHSATALQVLGRQLRNPLLLLLAAAAITSVAVGEHTDAVIILGIVVLSVGLGFFNEYRSERTLEELHAAIVHRTVVIRDGTPSTVDVTTVVPGDLVRLRPGDVVPADLRLVETNELECDEAVLTGEAMPRTKLPAAETLGEAGELGLRSIAFMGTTVRGGSGTGVVVRTGAETAFGQIAQRLGEGAPVTTFQRGLNSLSGLLVRVTAVLAVVIFVANSLLGRPLLESALFSLAIAVGLTPQLLPAIVTVSLASGARRLAARRVVVKRLISIEDLGNIEILFTDKTGTLTEGRIRYDRSLDAFGAAADAPRLLALAAIADAVDEEASGNALDAALLESASPPAGYRVLSQVPFDHERRLASAVVESPGGGRLLVTKGAPEAVLARCVRVDARSSKAVDDLFATGARVIAVATRAWPGTDACALADERDLELCGFISFIDAPKADAARSLAELKALGVDVKIVTGDNPQVALWVCATLGLRAGEVLTGAELETLSDAQLSGRLDATGIFARVSPDQKSRIISLQRAAGRDVGYLGDGVNDAVALRDSDVGISVDSGSEVAKDAADIVLLDKDLGILAGGVLEGRRIFANTMKYVLMGTSSNFGNMFSAAAGSVLLNFLPMTPTQILLNNLLYDTGEMTIPTDRVDPEAVERPAHWDIRMVRRFMLFFGPISSLFDFLTFGLMLFVFHARGSLFQTGWFVESLATQSLVIFAIRTRRVPFFRSRPSPALTAGTLGAVAVGVGLPYSPLAGWFGFTPLPATFLAAVALMVVVYLALIETGKRWFFRRSRGTPRRMRHWQPSSVQRSRERLAAIWSRPRPRRRRTVRRPRLAAATGAHEGRAAINRRRGPAGR